MGTARDEFRWALLLGVLGLALMEPRAGMAAEPNPTANLKLPDLSRSDPAADEAATHRPVLSWDTGAGKSYFIPALEIVGFEFLLNQFDRHFMTDPAYREQLVFDQAERLAQMGHRY